MLRYAARNDVYDHLADLGDQLRSGLTDLLEDRAPRYTVTGYDSMFKVVFTRDGSLENSADVDAAETERWERLFWPAMRDEGVFLTANQYESQFLSYAHTEEDVEETLEAYKEAL
jgi:glutamate-1-semialdehyde 2,1-aminomutase